jgi:TusA-related sulfurtransferase
MDSIVDARGLACPRPSHMTIEAIRLAKQGETITVLTDKADARDSVIRVVKAFQLPYELERKAKHYEIRISRDKLWLEK